MCVKLNSLFDKEMKVYYMLQVFKCLSKVLKECVLTTFSSLETRNHIHGKSI